MTALTLILTLTPAPLMPFGTPPPTHTHTTHAALFDRDGDGGVDRREFFYLVEYIVVQNALAMAQPKSNVRSARD